MQELNERQPIITKATTALLECTDPFLFKLWAIPRASQHIWNVSRLSDLTHEVLYYPVPCLFLSARHSSDVMLKAWNNLSPKVSIFHSLTSFKSMINSDFFRKTYWATLPQMWVPCFAFFASDLSVTCISLYIWYLLLSLSFCYNVNPNWARNCLTLSLVLVWNSFWHTVCDQ